MSDFTINFQAIINKIQTTIDGGGRVTLDLGEPDLHALKALLDYKDRVIQVSIKSVE